MHIVLCAVDGSIPIAPPVTMATMQAVKSQAALLLRASVLSGVVVAIAAMSRTRCQLHVQMNITIALSLREL